MPTATHLSADGQVSPLLGAEIAGGLGIPKTSRTLGACRQLRPPLLLTSELLGHSSCVSAMQLDCVRQPTAHAAGAEAWDRPGEPADSNASLALRVVSGQNGKCHGHQKSEGQCPAAVSGT